MLHLISYPSCRVFVLPGAGEPTPRRAETGASGRASRDVCGSSRDGARARILHHVSGPTARARGHTTASLPRTQRDAGTRRDSQRGFVGACRRRPARANEATDRGTRAASSGKPEQARAAAARVFQGWWQTDVVVTLEGGNAASEQS